MLTPLKHKNKLSLNLDLIILLIFSIVSIVFALILGQDVSIDRNAYHIYNGWALINSRTDIDVTAADGLHGYFSPVLDAIQYLGFHYLCPVIYVSMLGMISGIGAFICYKINKMILPNNLLIILCATLISTTGVASLVQMAIITNENIIALILIFGFYQILKYYQNPKSKHLIFSGIALGLAFGFKMTAVTSICAIIVGCFLQARNHKTKFLILLFTFILTFILVDGFWLLKMYRMFGNPIYPNFGHLINPKTAINFSRDDRFIPKDLKHFLLMPFYIGKFSIGLNAEPGMSDWRLFFSFISILGIILTWRKQYNTKLPQQLPVSQIALHQTYIRFTVATFLIAFYVWMLLFSIQRYTIFLEYLSGTIVIYGVTRIQLMKNSKHLRVAMIVSCVVLTLAIVVTTRFVPSSRVPISIQLKTINAKMTDSLVVLGGVTSYIAPLLGLSNVYINTPDNSFNCEMNRKKKEDLIKYYKAHNKKIYFIYPDSNHEDLNWLSAYGLAINENDCYKLSTPAHENLCLLH